jgi:hypothetical protein
VSAHLQIAVESPPVVAGCVDTGGWRLTADSKDTKCRMVPGLRSSQGEKAYAECRLKKKTAR